MYEAVKQDAFYNSTSLSTAIYRRLKGIYFGEKFMMNDDGLGGFNIRPKGRGAISPAEQDIINEQE